MIRKLTITILVDNKPGNPEVLAEHGLTLWIEADDRRILFDTGQSDMLIRNAEVLGIDLRTADTLVLSHGHYDHTGGVAAVLDLNPGISIYCHPGIFMSRYSQQPDGKMKPIGITKLASVALYQVVDSIHWTSGPTLISADIGITGPIPRLSNFEDTGGAFFLDPEATKQDPIDDDLAMWFKTLKGIVLVTGCCHSGLVNTINCTKALTDNTPIYAIVGGFHLLHASPERMEKTSDYLHLNGIEQIVPCHCTGENAVEHLNMRCGQKIIPGGSGVCFHV